MKKGIILTAMISCMIFATFTGTAFADDSASATTGSISLSLAQAYEQIKSSDTYELIQLQNANDNAVIKGYSETASSLKESGETKTSSANTLKIQRSYANSVVEANSEARMNQLNQEIFEKYYSLQNTETEAQIASDSLQIKERLLEIANKKYALGTVSKLDVLSAEIDATNAQNLYEIAKNALSEARMSFNLYFGYDIMQKVVLTDEIKESELPATSVETAVAAALENRLELKEAAYKLQLAKYNFNSYSAYPSTSSRYLTAKISYLNAQIDYDSKAGEIETDVRSKYMAMIEKYNAVQSGVKSLQSAEESLKIVEARYELGMSTLADVQQTQITLYNSKLSYAQNLLSYNLAVEEYNLSMGVGTSVVNL